MTYQSNFNDKIALITGAGRGIGRAIARSVAAAGSQVVLTARTERELNETADEIKQNGGRAIVIPADLTAEDQILALFGEVSRRFGRLDVTVNNAGIGLFGPTVDFPVGQFDAIFAANVRGTFLCCRESLKVMLPARSGYIINIASVVGIKGYPRQAAYSASKHAVMGLTKALAAEMNGQGVRVSAILPGGVDTNMVGDARPDLNRNELLQPEDVAQSVMYLLSLSDRAAVDEIYIRRRNSAPF
ncbi:MAG TPA: SDR family oxidoreductase [Tepidisphaeraceae bacterium]|jgi:3-oxoacyl-[acyl-carrier protein] reductase|nr:SDR family oxidoreductase [Tepidisphaeraceae bacterium]